MESLLAWVAEEGADAICYKPFKVESLLETITRLTPYRRTRSAWRGTSESGGVVVSRHATGDRSTASSPRAFAASRQLDISTLEHGLNDESDRYAVSEAAMNRSLRIAIAEDEPDMRDYFRTILPLMGHSVYSVAATGKELVEQVLSGDPELVITDIKMPDLDGIDAARLIYERVPLPIILVSAHYERDLLKHIEEDFIQAYLVKPIKQEELGPAIALAYRRFEHFQALRQEAASLRQALEDRKLIEKAKGILMKNTELDEDQAFRRMQRIASEKNLKLLEIARSILTADEAFKSKNDSSQKR